MPNCAILFDLPDGRAATVSLGVQENPAYALRTCTELIEYTLTMEAHEPGFTDLGLGFAMLSALIGLVVGLLGAWLVS